MATEEINCTRGNLATILKLIPMDEFNISSDAEHLFLNAVDEAHVMMALIEIDRNLFEKDLLDFIQDIKRLPKAKLMEAIKGIFGDDTEPVSIISNPNNLMISGGGFERKIGFLDEAPKISLPKDALNPKNAVGMDLEHLICGVKGCIAVNHEATLTMTKEGLELFSEDDDRADLKLEGDSTVKKRVSTRFDLNYILKALKVCQGKSVSLKMTKDRPIVVVGSAINGFVRCTYMIAPLVEE